MGKIIDRVRERELNRRIKLRREEHLDAWNRLDEILEPRLAALIKEGNEALAAGQWREVQAPRREPLWDRLWRWMGA